MSIDLKYIIKRIIIGVGIALVLMYLKGGLIADVYAITSSYSFGAKDETFGTNYAVFTYSTTGNPWTNYSDGTFTFSFQAYKTGGDSISSNALLRHVVINSSNGSSFACNVGTTTIGNSTFNNGLYSASCPVTFENNSYFQSIVFYFDSNNAVTGPNFRFLWNGLITYSSKPQSNTNVNVDTSGTTSAINNQVNNDNTNTQNIINNQDSNTQDIINNQNSNTDKEIESQKVCTLIDKNKIFTDNKYLNSNGIETNLTTFGITDFIPISSSTIDNLELYEQNWQIYSCFYNANKEIISCFLNQRMTTIIPSNASFIRLSINKELNKPQFKLCTTGNQAIVNSQQDLNNTLNNDNVDTQQAGDFFSSFQHDSHGLSGVVTAPLRLINSLTTASCSPLEFNLPFVHNHVVLPCMKPFYQNYFGVFFSLWQLITTGLISYNILINLYSKIHNLQNPNNDRIEVLNL